MFRLMKSEKLDSNLGVLGLSEYRQVQVDRFDRIQTAMRACDVANNAGRSRHYLLDDEGKEYYCGTWID